MVQQISKFKKVLYAIGVFSLITVSAPLVTGNAVYADACPRNVDELNTAINSRPRETNITLCGNIDGAINISTNSPHNFTINLNGKTVSNNGGTVISVRNSTLTITGNGSVNGGINANTNRLIITGGTYTVDPSSYINDETLKAYGGNGSWSVEPKITATNFDVTPASILIRQGQTSNLEITKPAGSTTSATYQTNNDAIATVDNNGVVTGVAAGNTTITVASTYESTVTKTVDVEVLPALTSVSAEDITIRVGKNSTITPAVEDASITGATFSYVSGDENIATVDADGNVSGVAAGKTTITIAASYTDTIGEMTITGTVNVSVYDVQAGDNDEEEIAANTVKDIVDEGLPDDMENASDTQKEAFGSDYAVTGASLKDAMNDGVVVTTKVNVKESTDTSAIAKIDEALADIDVAETKYYDVTVLMNGGNASIGLLHKLNSKLTVAIAEVEDPADGYTRKYYVVAYHEGDSAAEILVENEGYIIKDGKIYIISDRFSTFAVAYEDILDRKIVSVSNTLTAPDTGVNTDELGSASVSMSVVVFGVITMINLVGIAVFVKRR